MLSLVVDGRLVEVPDDGATLLTVLRERLGMMSVKDGCSPQASAGAAPCWWTGNRRWPA